MTNQEIMNLGIEEAKKTMKANIGGPFGAVIVKDGEVISIASNTVLKSKDPTAHAEVNAIRKACAKLGTYDLSGCVLYATGYPCPMCLGAIIWANIKTIYVCGLPQDAESLRVPAEGACMHLREEKPGQGAGRGSDPALGGGDRRQSPEPFGHIASV